MVSDLQIGKVIRKLRKSENMTQEELADKLGVSSPAVSKWENNNSYPDIALLPILAKTLNTSIDDLLNFTPKTTQEELNSLIYSCCEQFDKGLFGEAYQLIEQYLEQYPSDLNLKHHVATILSVYYKHSPDPDFYLNLAITLSEEATVSTDMEVSVEARKILSHLYIMANELELAENLIKETLLKVDESSNLTLAIIYYKKGDIESARKIYQRTLYHHLCEMNSVLSSLSSTVGKNDNENIALKYQNTILKLLEVFDLREQPAFTLNTYVSLTNYYASKEMEEETLFYLIKMQKAFLSWDEVLNLSGNVFFDTLGSKPEKELPFTNTMNRVFATIIENVSGFEFLKTNNDYIESIKVMQQHIADTVKTNDSN